MADTKISALSSGAPAQAVDEYVIARSGSNFKLTGTNLLALVTSTANTFTAAQTLGSGLLKLTGATSGTITLNATAVAGTNTLTLPAATDTIAVVGTAQTFTAAQTFRAANAVRSEAAATQDAVVLAGRAGGTNSYAVTLTPTTLSSSTTLTLPNVSSTVAVLGTAQTFTAAQTFASGDIKMNGSSSGTITFAVPAAAGTNTVTFPAETMTVGFRNVPQSGSDKTTSYSLVVGDVGKFVGVGTSGSITIPDATFAAGDVVSLFNNTSGNITVTCTITTAYIAGADADVATVSLATRGVATILFLSGTVCVISGNVS